MRQPVRIPLPALNDGGDFKWLREVFALLNSRATHSVGIVYFLLSLTRSTFFLELRFRDAPTDKQSLLHDG